MCLFLMGYFPCNYEEDDLSKDKRGRRTWTPEEKRAIIGEIGIESASVLDVSKRYNLDRYLLKRWMRQLRVSSPEQDGPAGFVPVEVRDLAPAATPSVVIEVCLSSGRHVRLPSELGDDQIRRFVALVEAA